MRLKYKIISSIFIVLMTLSPQLLAGSKTNNKNNLEQQRIISLAPHITEILFSLGVGDKIVAAINHSDFPEAAKKIPRVGNYARLKIEKILALEPDLIIAWRTGNPASDMQKLEKLGLNVIYSEPKQLEDVAHELRLFGKKTGSSKQAEILANKYEIDLKKLRDTYANKKTLSVFYELWSNPLTTVSNNAWPQQHLDVCGVTNTFINSVGDYPQVGLEQVVIAKPQLIIQPISINEPNRSIVNWSKWHNIPATQYKQFIKPNSDKLHRMTPRVLPELEKLCIDIDKSRKWYFKT